MSVIEGSRAIDAVFDDAPPRHIDYETARIDMLARSWIDVQQTRLSLAQRELDDSIVSSFAKGEAQLSRALTRTLRAHALWPWLSQFPGLGGAHTALVIGRLGDPRRFPGQRCSEGHYLPPLYTVGDPCPIAEASDVSDVVDGDGADIRADESRPEIVGGVVCAGLMLPPRESTGVRSLWHWAGLHATDEGRAPRKIKGQRCTWDPRVRASVLQPGGIAEQIVRLGVPVYVDVYRAAKARLTLRVAAGSRVSDAALDDAKSLCATETSSVIEVPPGSQRATVASSEIGTSPGRPLRPFEADRIARKVAAKAFLGDLLTAWKEIA